MKLKTLNDLKLHVSVDSLDYPLASAENLRDDLKAEAIKWVKLYKDQNKSNRILFGDKVIKSMEEGNELLILWITDFFNITEEDLQ